MKQLYVFIPILLLACGLPGCIENPIFDDGSSYENPPVDYPPPPGPPNVSGRIEMTSATGVIGREGTMTVYVKVNNADGVERAYDIQGDIYVDDGPSELGNASIYLGDLDANQWTDTHLDIPINLSKFPSSATKLTLYLRWWDAYDNMYESQVTGFTLFKAPA